MNTELLPESIRGGWYFVGAEAELLGGDETEAEVLVFRLDGTYSRYELAEGERLLEEEGEYTFDGHFLIVRGSETNTYRTAREAPWRWHLEGKEDDHLLLRGWSGREEPVELGEARVREIEKVPARVFVRSEFEGPKAGEICSLVHESGGEQVRVGACFAEPAVDGEVWIALTPLTHSISESLWRRIVRRSYLDIYREDDAEVERIEIVE